MEIIWKTWIARSPNQRHLSKCAEKCIWFLATHKRHSRNAVLNKAKPSKEPLTCCRWHQKLHWIDTIWTWMAPARSVKYLVLSTWICRQNFICSCHQVDGLRSNNLLLIIFRYPQARTTYLLFGGANRRYWLWEQRQCVFVLPWICCQQTVTSLLVSMTCGRLPQVHYRVHTSPSLVPIQRPRKPVYTLVP
jgi:hypothetical protein